jgi:hypothetical protein
VDPRSSEFRPQFGSHNQNLHSQRQSRQHSDFTQQSTPFRFSSKGYPVNNTGTMGRMHSNGKGISAPATPYSRVAPAWLKTTPEQVVEQICRLAKRGATPSQIGVILRDSHGIAQVRIVTGRVSISQ